MSDLISRSVLLRKIAEEYDLNYGEILIDPERFYEMVEAMPTAYDIEKVLAEECKNTSIITDFLQYARDNADNYDTNEGWSLADLIDLSIKYSEEYINTSTDTDNK